MFQLVTDSQGGHEITRFSFRIFRHNDKTDKLAKGFLFALTQPLQLSCSRKNCNFPWIHPLVACGAWESWTSKYVTLWTSRNRTLRQLNFQKALRKCNGILGGTSSTLGKYLAGGISSLWPVSLKLPEQRYEGGQWPVASPLPRTTCLHLASNLCFGITDWPALRPSRLDA